MRDVFEHLTLFSNMIYCYYFFKSKSKQMFLSSSSDARSLSPLLRFFCVQVAFLE